MKSGRAACCVPFCRRTFKAAEVAGEAMCGKHWRLARPALRRRHSHIVRRYRSAVLKADWLTAERAWRLEKVLWQAIKKEAIEIAVGIAA